MKRVNVWQNVSCHSWSIVLGKALGMSPLPGDSPHPLLPPTSSPGPESVPVYVSHGGMGPSVECHETLVFTLRPTLTQASLMWHDQGHGCLFAHHLWYHNFFYGSTDMVSGDVCFCPANQPFYLKMLGHILSQYNWAQLHWRQSTSGLLEKILPLLKWERIWWYKSHPDGIGLTGIGKQEYLLGCCASSSNTC